MIIELKGNIVFQINNPFQIQRSEELKSKIAAKWRDFIKGKSLSDYYNGDVFLVTNITNNGSDYIFEIGKTSYSDLIYIKDSSDMKARSLFVASYILTSDNNYCIIKDKRNRINTIGGLADPTDFYDGQFIPQNCLRREVMEELGLDLLQNEFFDSVTAKFIKIPKGPDDNLSLYPVGILYEIRTVLNSEELSKKFEENRSLTDGETEELLFLNKRNYGQIDQRGNTVSYIHELFSFLINN